MKFVDMFVSQRDRFSLGIEGDSGRFYLAIPVSNRLVDYEEQYEISEEQFKSVQRAFDELAVVAGECRRRERDDALMVAPGRIRGEPI